MEIDGVLIITVTPGAKTPTPEQKRAYQDTLDWSDPLHMVKWDGETFTELEVQNVSEGTN